MAVSVSVTGGADLTQVRRNLRMLGDKGLSQQMSRGLQRAAKAVGPEVRAEVAKVMPSGYAPVLSKSLRFRTSAAERGGSASVTIRVYGDGKKEKRDVVRLNRGELRHPVFGRSRPLKNHARHRATAMANPWVSQKVRPGFVDRPVDRLVPEVRREMQQVVDWVADQITRG